MISYLLGAYLDWRQLAMLVSVAPMMLFITVIYIPETPSFLVLKGCDDDAYRCELLLMLFYRAIINQHYDSLRSLQWLRGPEKNVELELDTIKSNIRSTRRLNINGSLNNNLTDSVNRNSTMNRYAFKTILNNIKSVLKNARLIRPVLITCGLMIFQRFTGLMFFYFQIILLSDIYFYQFLF